MFNRFTHSARESVEAAQGLAEERQDSRIEPAHLLIGSGIADPRIGEVLDAFGCDRNVIVDCLDHGFDKLLLESIGIDLDEVNAMADSSDCAGTLDRSDRTVPWYRRGPGGSYRFSKPAKTCLEQALRSALEEKSSEVTARHIALAALERSQQLHAVLLSQGVDVGRCAEHLDGLSLPSSA